MANQKLGVLIPDGGLRLGILDVWMRIGALPDVRKAFDAAAERIRADDDLHYEEGGERHLDLEDASVVDDVLSHAVAALADVEFEESLLDSVESLNFDGGSEIYCELILDELSSRLGCQSWRLDTGGETDVFQVSSLEGLGRLRSLKALNLDAHGYCDGGHDLAPLRDHPTLQSIQFLEIASDAEALTTLPSLRELRHVRGLPDEVRASLKARGVVVPDP